MALRLIRGLLVLSTLLCAGQAFQSCSVERHYRVLSFFFDGVPDPNAPPPAEMVTVKRFDVEEFAKLSGAERAAYLGRRIEAPTVHFHKPVAERKCDQCHNMEQTGGGVFSGGLPTLLAPPEELCLRCHEEPTEPYVHGPVARGYCVLCHHPHQSPYPHLLREARQADLCGRCHAGELFVTAELHQGFGDAECTTCHDPHSSDRLFLLRSDLPGSENGDRDGVDREE